MTFRCLWICLVIAGLVLVSIIVSRHDVGCILQVLKNSGLFQVCGACTFSNIAEWRLRIFQLCGVGKFNTLLSGVVLLWAADVEKLTVDKFVVPSCTRSEASSRKDSPEFSRRRHVWHK